LSSADRRVVRARIHGRVQGVWFRAWTQRTASALGLDGYEPIDDLGDSQHPVWSEVHEALAEHFKATGYDIKDLFRLIATSDAYRRIFPSVQFTKKSETELETSAGGGRLATSIGGTLTGRGGDIIIIDDPLKAEEAQSEDARRNVINWYKRTLLSRLNDKRRGVIILVMQRLHEEDLSGYLLEQGGWHHLDLPAIAIETQDIRIGPNATDVHCRKEGDVLHPGREPFDALMAIKNAIGSQLFSAQYQQRPVPAEGNLIKREWLKFYDSMPEGWPEVQIIQSWDIAGTVKETGNYSVCTTWAVHKKTYYLIDVWRGRLEYPDLRRKVISMQEEFGAKTVLIEMAGLGLNLVHDLLNDSPIGFPNPIGIEPKGDKRDRMAAASAQIEAGHMLLPKEAPWLGDFMHELLAFPGGRYDDQVDSVSQFINWNGKRSKPRVSLFGPKVFYAK